MRSSFRDLEDSELAEEVVIYRSLMTLRGRNPRIYWPVGQNSSNVFTS